MFRAVPLPIIRSLFTVHSAMVYAIQVCRQLSSRTRMELQFHPTPGSKRSSQLQKFYQSRCKVKNSWWWAERLPETCRVVIPLKLEFGASVGFIHKDVEVGGFSNITVNLIQLCALGLNDSNLTVMHGMEKEEFTPGTQRSVFHWLRLFKTFSSKISLQYLS